MSATIAKESSAQEAKVIMPMATGPVPYDGYTTIVVLNGPSAPAMADLICKKRTAVVLGKDNDQVPDLLDGEANVLLPLSESNYGLHCGATKFITLKEGEKVPEGAKRIKRTLYFETRVTKGLARLLELRGTCGLVLIINKTSSTETFNFYGEQFYGTRVTVASNCISKEDFVTEAFDASFHQAADQSLEDFIQEIVDQNFGV